MRSLDFSRSDRVSDLVKSEISLILRDEVKDPRLKGLTVVRVKLSQDIRKANVYFSRFNSFNNTDKEDVFLGLDKAKGFIRSLLSQRLSLKRVPEIYFEEDKPEQLL